MESVIQLILNKLETLTDSINEKTVNQTVFVRARPGLGYDSKMTPLLVPLLKLSQEKLTRELTKKAETLD